MTHRLKDVDSRLPRDFLDVLMRFFENKNNYNRFAKDLEEYGLHITDKTDEWQITFHNMGEVDYFIDVMTIARLPGEDYGYKDKDPWLVKMYKKIKKDKIT